MNFFPNGILPENPKPFFPNSFLPTVIVPEITKFKI